LSGELKHEILQKASANKNQKCHFIVKCFTRFGKCFFQQPHPAYSHPIFANPTTARAIHCFAVAVQVFTVAVQVFTVTVQVFAVAVHSFAEGVFLTICGGKRLF
jgi:hypothetical protein